MHAMFAHTVHLIADLQAIELNKDMRICWFDRENMCINTPKIDIIYIICNTLGSNPEINMNIRKEILHILETVMEQNYFQSDQQYYKQTDGLAMCAPISSTLAETYIQHIEHKQIYHILIKR
jgi:hypothetical protein